MKKHRIVWSTLLLVLALWCQASQFAQNIPIRVHQESGDMKQRSMVGLVRQISTIEVTDFSQYGSYESWQTLRERHPRELNEWLARNLREANVHFGDMPEILPEWNLRLNVNADGQGYVLLLEDSADKTGYAVLNDERGVIRLCRYLGN